MTVGGGARDQLDRGIPRRTQRATLDREFGANKATLGPTPVRRVIQEQALSPSPGVTNRVTITNRRSGKYKPRRHTQSKSSLVHASGQRPTPQCDSLPIVLIALAFPIRLGCQQRLYGRTDDLN